MGRARLPVLLVGDRRRPRHRISREEPDAARTRSQPRPRILGRLRHRPRYASRTMWRGTGVTPRALAPGSYIEADRKTPGGQSPAPEPDGRVWLANGIYPGWQSGTSPAFEDPREPAPSVDEVGRGPLPESLARFKAVRLVGNGALLEYTVRGADVREWLTATEESGRSAIVRSIEIAPIAEPVSLVVGVKAKDGVVSLCRGSSDGAAALESVAAPAITSDLVWSVKVAAHSKPVRLCVAISDATLPDGITFQAAPTTPAAARWPQQVTTTVKMATARDAYVVDDFELPVANPWRRNVRPGDIQFLKDGTGVLVTIDGDVWNVRGLHQSGGPIVWRRFASGLHEPLTLAIRDEQIHVFDRNGIWRCATPTRTARPTSTSSSRTHSRRPPTCASSRARCDSAPVASSSSRRADRRQRIGKHNGSVLRISADGTTATVLGYGFRQPKIGVNVRTGLVTSSDQQGHYIPSTPLHIVRDRQFYGFLAASRRAKFIRRRPPSRSRGFRIRSMRQRCRRCGCSTRRWVR